MVQHLRKVLVSRDLYMQLEVEHFMLFFTSGSSALLHAHFCAGDLQNTGSHISPKIKDHA